MFRFAAGLVVGVLMALAMRRLLAVPAPALSAISGSPLPETETKPDPIEAIIVPVAALPPLSPRLRFLRWSARKRAVLMRFLKVFAFVLLGLVAASLTTPEGLSALLEPQALIVLLVASMVGAILKGVQWQDVTTDAVPSVTMQFTPPKAVTPPLAEGLAQ